MWSLSLDGWGAPAGIAMSKSGIMYLIPQDTNPSSADVSGSPDAGAPEFEITPAMIEAGVAVLSEYGTLDGLLDGSRRLSDVVEHARLWSE
jgi:hypothetical protein